MSRLGAVQGQGPFNSSEAQMCWGVPMTHAIRRTGMLALPASSLVGAYPFLKRCLSSGTDVPLSTSELGVASPPEVQPRQPLVPIARAARLQAALGRWVLGRGSPQQLRGILERAGFVRPLKWLTAGAPKTNTARGAVEAAEATLFARQGLLRVPARGDGTARCSPFHREWPSRPRAETRKYGFLHKHGRARRDSYGAYDL